MRREPPPLAPQHRLPLEETTEQTLRRIRTIAAAELDATLARGHVDATAFDGSVASGQVWPSSDVDVTAVPTDSDKWNVRWSVRDGLVVHTHLSPWNVLDDLRRGYPKSFVDTAAGDWIRDPTWLLDGLASMQPVHDPHGRLADLKAFMRAHRFRPDVTEPRRPLLFARAARYRALAEDYVAAADPKAWRHAEMAIEALAFIWLEAAERIFSRKEIDPTLAEACRQFGAPHAHTLFRQATGVAGLEARAEEIAAAFRALLLAYSAWLEPLLPAYPSGKKEPDEHLEWHTYLRHEYWAGLYAPTRSCILHLAVLRPHVRGLSTKQLRSVASTWRAATGLPPFGRAHAATYAAIDAARERVLPLLEPAPWPERLAALAELEALTHRTF